MFVLMICICCMLREFSRVCFIWVMLCRLSGIGLE